MAILLIPIFFMSLAFVILGFLRSTDKLRPTGIFLLGLPIYIITFPILMSIFNGMSGGLIENKLGTLWNVVGLLTIQDGDIYIGAVGLMLVIAALVLLSLQVYLARKKVVQND